jgi:hypothetical protein
MQASRMPGFLARLFGGSRDEEEDAETAASVAVVAAPAETVNLRFPADWTQVLFSPSPAYPVTATAFAPAPALPPTMGQMGPAQQPSTGPASTEPKKIRTVTIQAPPAAPAVSGGSMNQVGAEPATTANATPWPLADRSGSEPIPNALAYAAQPTPIAVAGPVPLAFGTPRAASTAPAETTIAKPTSRFPATMQKVVLYEEDPAHPNGKRFVGSAIWQTEMVTPAPGQPPELAIRADVEVPERKLAMTWSLRRNTDKSLPATHTVEIVFKLPTDFPAGGILNVPGMLMKQAEQTRGVPLSGLAVKVTAGFYLIGLSNLEADKERNLQMLKDRDWIDIPVVYSNNRRAILAMEKGTSGERAFADAFKAWKE